MRISVELDKSLLQEVLRLTGESKMSSAVAKAAKLFVNRKKASAIVRSLREEPMNYELTNDQVENVEEIVTKVEHKKVGYRKSTGD